MGKYRLIKVSLILLLLSVTPLAWGDAGLVAQEWVTEHTRDISERLCRQKALSDVNTIILNVHQKLLEVGRALRAIKSRTLAAENILLKTSVQTTPLAEDNYYSFLMGVIESEKVLLQTYERFYVELQIVQHLSKTFSSIEERFSSYSDRENLASQFQRPELRSEVFLVDVDDADGVNFEFSTRNVFETVGKLAKSTWESVRNYNRNRTINSRLQEARDQFYALQVTQAEFSEMVLAEFISRREPYAQSIETLRTAIDATQKRLENRLRDSLRRFSYLDRLRVEMIRKYHGEAYRETLNELRREWYSQDARLFKVSFRQKLRYLQFQEILAHGRERGSQIFEEKNKLLNEHFETYRQILGMPE